MFEWINKQGVRSDKGFVVQRTGRFSMEYREGEMRIEFLVESDADGSINFEMRWPFYWNGQEVSVERRDEIVQNLVAALKFKNLKPRIFDPRTKQFVSVS